LSIGDVADLVVAEIEFYERNHWSEGILVQVCNFVVRKIQEFATHEAREDLLVQLAYQIVLQIDCFIFFAASKSLGGDGRNIVERSVEMLQFSGDFEHLSVDAVETVVLDLEMLEVWKGSEDLHLHFHDSVVV